MSQPPPRRKRTRPSNIEGDAPSSNRTTDLRDEDRIQALVKDAEFWFEDGSIILIAGDVVFRVYKGVLASASPVFADMFSLPTPGPRPAVDGCPVVNLQDSADDVRRLLRLVMPKNGACVLEDLNMLDISAGVRLGHKYQMDTVVKRLAARLGQYYTKHWAGWRDPSRSSFPECLRGTAAIAVVNIARLTDELWLLPAALFECLELPTLALLSGFKRGDGTVEHLSHEDLARCIDARPIVKRDEIISAIDYVFDYDLKKCANDDSDRCYATLHALQQDPGFLYHDYQPYRDFTQRKHSWSKRVRPSLCGGCYHAVVEREEEGCKLFFKNLPVYFGLEIRAWGKV
ncbi:uncharacterized protein BXZ73DRAFT_41734 [Epithele typhae]|uniref:uncharacterized protein n=1 Tax=Epithele typhae TaxID=378194 RepID=UPI0020081C80|nr:uncharacterized protein BXZ73DRAFT_41734 [Epithele typhae]KAH9941831.1 hypothetical protein BXZ73DRAFT_41734 [Epithele typhae]